MKKIIRVLSIIILFSIVLMNLWWGVFRLRCYFYARSLPYNRIKAMHILEDYDRRIRLCGFDEIEYMQFTAEGQVSKIALADDENDVLFIRYSAFKGITYEYHFRPQKDNVVEASNRYITINLNKNGSLVKINDWKQYENYRERIRELLAIARETWGIDED